MKRSLFATPLIALMFAGCGDLTTNDTNTTNIGNLSGEDNTIVQSLQDTNATAQDNNNDSVKDIQDVNITTSDNISPIEANKALSYYGVKMFTELDDTWSNPLMDGSWTIWSKDIDNFDVIAVTYEGVGTVKIGLVETYNNDEYGIIGKSKFKDFKETLDSKYIKVDEFDFCSGNDYVCKSSNFSYSLYTEDRFLDAYYTDEHNTTISLSLEKGVYTTDTRLKIVYQTQKFSDIKNDEKEAVSSKL